MTTSKDVRMAEHLVAATEREYFAENNIYGFTSRSGSGDSQVPRSSNSRPVWLLVKDSFYIVAPAPDLDTRATRTFSRTRFAHEEWPTDSIHTIISTDSDVVPGGCGQLGVRLGLTRQEVWATSQQRCSGASRLPIRLCAFTRLLPSFLGPGDARARMQPSQSQPTSSFQELNGQEEADAAAFNKYPKLNHSAVRSRGSTPRNRLYDGYGFFPSRFNFRITAERREARAGPVYRERQDGENADVHNCLQYEGPTYASGQYQGPGIVNAGKPQHGRKAWVGTGI
ncbi:hypothetical protein B0H10DRAFT_1965355 [Mycena sp. CBHHK59/15]|nr:hypothetical protein B0H10DRAFT_1965355 [Mycena sp. CBHHK59/15]